MQRPTSALKDKSNTSTLKKTGSQSRVNKPAEEDFDSNLEKAQSNNLMANFDKLLSCPAPIKLLSCNPSADLIKDTSPLPLEYQIVNARSYTENGAESEKKQQIMGNMPAENTIEVERMSVPDEMNLSSDASGSKQMDKESNEISYNGDSLKGEIEYYQSYDSSEIDDEEDCDLEDVQPKNSHIPRESKEYTEVSISDELTWGKKHHDKGKSDKDINLAIQKSQSEPIFDGYLIDDPGNSKLWVLTNTPEVRGRLHCSNCGSNRHSKARCTIMDENKCLNCLGDHPRRYCESEGGCFVCGSFDHIKARCNFKHKRRCLRCKKAHPTAECTYILSDQLLVSKDQIENESIQCLICFNFGHLNCGEIKSQRRNGRQVIEDGVFSPDYTKRLGRSIDYTKFKVSIDREIDELKYFQFSLGSKRPNNPALESPTELLNTKKVKESSSRNAVTIGDHLAQVDKLDIFGKESIDPEADNYLQEYINFYKNQTGNHEKDFEALSESSEEAEQNQAPRGAINYKKLLKKRDLENMKKRKKRRQANKTKRAERGNNRNAGKFGRDKRISKDSKRFNRKR